MQSVRFNVLVIAFIIASATTFSGFAQESTCNRILSLGFHNVKKKFGERASLYYKYKSYCGIDYSKWDDNQMIEASVDATGYGSMDGKYSRSQAETKLKSWCDNNKEISQASGKDIEESQDVNLESVRAWQSCN